MGNQISLIKLSLFFFCLPSSPFVSSECVCVFVINYFEFVELNGTACHFLNFMVASVIKI